MRNKLAVYTTAILASVLWLQIGPASAMEKKIIKGPEQVQSRAYSPAIITDGGKLVWIAGQTTVSDANGKSLSGDFEGQARDVFRRIEETLKKADAKLSDIVTMTVFITDPRYGDKFVAIRREVFGDNFPASALITVSGLATPDRLVEVQAIAVKQP